ncbi:leucine-rich repeat-containing protein 52 [Alligator mississippiensis]|uniref:Leucine-rich repeat-containing protein 52 n=1 Tax=Alligator sinensis TaxID=38654 RepID=A0A1U7R5V4_ALLSI|nr:leucine-rich repeat-containing protein 52 [Alligator sinensis]XP_006273016.1 leucine-rich repeat-containing protein 52 [Alligator mississippiensis]
MSSSNSPRSLRLVFIFGIGLASKVLSCPPNCTCQYLEVNCTGRQLQEYPLTIPLDTRQLILATNNISYLPSVELNFLTDLVYLDCRENHIGEDLGFTFISVVKLVYLDLSANNLTRVTFTSFSQLTNLVVLKLSDNPNLVEIEKDSFANNSWLRHLDVSRTGLTFLDTSTVSDLANLKSLGLSGNPWNCSCSFLEFSIWIKESGLNFPDAENISCYSPSELRGWPVPDVETQLHYICLTHLYQWDYIFLGLVGFCIFSAGTLAAWLAGICAVLYEFHTATGEDDADEEEEEEASTYN